MCGMGGPAGIRDSPLMYSGVGVLYLPTLHCDRYLASVGFMGKTADIVCTRDIRVPSGDV